MAAPGVPAPDPGVPATDPSARARELTEAAVAGDRRALARLLTAVENRTPIAEAALRTLYPMAGRAHLVGITGPPGAGKSTLVAALIALVRAAGRPVAVVAVPVESVQLVVQDCAAAGVKTLLVVSAASTIEVASSTTSVSATTAGAGEC